MRKGILSSSVAGLFVLAAAPSWAQQGSFSLGTGLTYTSGDYGSSTTTRTWSMPFTARYDRERWSFKASIPWMRVSGADNVIPGVGQATNTNPRARGRGRGAPAGAAPGAVTSATVSGWGDLVTSATYAAWQDQASGSGIDVTGKIKWGTADTDKGLGTGENDYSVNVDAYRTLNRVTLFGGVGYTDMGSSASIPLRNVWGFNLGLSYKASELDSVGVSYDARQRASATGAPIGEVTGFWSRRIDRNWKVQAFVLKGLENGSPDWGAGATAAYAF